MLDGILDMGFDTPTEIQQQAIPIALAGKNLLGTSFTGSGKTAAFVIPVLQKISSSRKSGIQALVLAPTRELAQQIDEQFMALGYHANISSASVYGGSDWAAQEKAMKAGVNVVVATPGRLLDQMKITTYDFSNIDVLVLDEADRMLDMGFLPDVRSIINRIPSKRQTLLFSATVNPRIESLAKEFTQGGFERIAVGRIAPAAGIDQYFYKVDDSRKKDLLIHLFKSQQWHSAIVFASTKRGVDLLSRSLNKMGVAVESMHGDREQKDREATLDRFRSGKTKVIVATDVMSRGIDVDNISHIINYDVPNDEDDYIHRIGRTARAESTGTAITFVSRRDWRAMLQIMDAKGLEIKEGVLPDEIAGQGSQDEASDDDDKGRGRGRSRGGRNRGRGNGNNDRNGSRNRTSSGETDQKSHARQEAPAEKSAESTSGSDEEEKASASSESSEQAKKNKRKRRPRRPRSGRKKKGNNDTPDTSDNKSDRNGEENSSNNKGEGGGPEKKRNKPRKRKPRGKKNNDGKDSGDNSADSKNSSKSKAGDRSGKRPGKRGQSRRRKPRQTGDRREVIQQQEKKIEQVQQSSLNLPEKKEKKAPDQGGFWGKLKKKILG
ncbi:Superfamily II DNA and RNA helicase [Cyclonatronum proteinivorum]|uniref:Superfamily II DNA and RNA helicase n=1 Tax=Cyclonatronum proteinivorum TaxID=1457365 RepID=A0A345UGG6_9BACT|nr:Superfamily II DNA and RNA helicase [Cyclonatronum proteinivorum]